MIKRFLVLECLEGEKHIYTQVTSKCRIQSDATVLSSRKITRRNSRLLPSYLTMKSALKPSQRASCLALHASLPIFNLDD